MSRRIVCALSGGVDSSVSAALLKEQGWDVVGLFMRSGISGHATGEKQGCCSVEDALDARRVADKLGIPFYALDMKEEFSRIVERFVESYASGETPNPCVLCNRWLKFGHVLAFADKIGAEKVATGHYARLDHDGRPVLRRPRDRKKDQTYVLAVLSPEQLARSVFPLADLEKPEVREKARALGLDRVAKKKDSVEICFVQDDYRPFVRERLPLHHAAVQPGNFVDTGGAKIGRHEGTLGFTIGQRKGLGQGFGERRYVTAVDPATATVVLGEKKDLEARALRARDFQWQAEPPRGSRRVMAQIRYNHAAVAATATVEEDGKVHVVFDVPEIAVAPGQLCALYDEEDDRVLGAGWIERALA
ncbi:MAG TPA: tRNA 2-thiouridine(34) synthase MnmA [Planctomycetota bacterium]|nr:tRNA 2-thiouridine(34) synthase MnmA [Planctomycetota bacterium]